MLPAAVAGVRTLAASTAYYFTTEIDLEGDRLVLSDSTVLLGTSSETAILKSTGLDSDTPLLTMETALSLPATLTISRRFRWTYSPLLVPPGCMSRDCRTP